jgi:RNA polymerase sigma factor (sigma-70 family)
VAALAERVRDGDRAAFAEMYDEYADPLYGFCVTLLRDRDEAADAVHDAFLLAAQRIGQLRDLERLNAWLFAIARHVCFRKLERRKRTTPTLVNTDAIVLDEDPIASLTAEEASALVWQAADGLADRDRAVLFLNMHEGLDGADLADALGVVQSNPYSLLHRAKSQLERAIGVLLVARTGRSDCAVLATMLDGWDGALTPLLRKRLARHIDECVVCQGTKSRVRPLAGLAAFPLLRPTRADALERRDYLDIASRQPAPKERWRGDGFPPPIDAPRRRRRRLLVLLVAVLAIGMGSAFEVAGAASENGGRSAPHPTPTTARTHARAKARAHAQGIAHTKPVTSTTLLATSLTATTRPFVAPVPTVVPVATTTRPPIPPTTRAVVVHQATPTTRAPATTVPAPPTTKPPKTTTTSLPGQ